MVYTGADHQWRQLGRWERWRWEQQRKKWRDGWGRTEEELTPSPPLQFCAASTTDSILFFNKCLFYNHGMIAILTKAKRQSQNYRFVKQCCRHPLYNALDGCFCGSICSHCPGWYSSRLPWYVQRVAFTCPCLTQNFRYHQLPVRARGSNQAIWKMGNEETRDLQFVIRLSWVDTADLLRIALPDSLMLITFFLKARVVIMWRTQRETNLND